MRILHVEDDSNVRGVIRKLLTEVAPICQTFYEAANFESGLKTLETSPIDVVLLDLGLPDSSTNQTIERIPLIDKYASVVVLSGQSAHLYRVQCHKAGAMAFLEKTAYVKAPAFLADAIFTAAQSWARFRHGNK